MSKTKATKPKREGLSLIQIVEMVPDEDAAHRWFAKAR